MRKKSIKLQEKELRKIARSVIIKDYLRILKEEKEEKSDPPKESPKEKEDPKEEKSDKEKLVDPLSLSKAAAPKNGRLGADDATEALAITGGMIYGGSSLVGGAAAIGLVSNPVGWGILATAAVAAGGYYLFGQANKSEDETLSAALDKNLYTNTKKFFEGLATQLNKAGQPDEANKMTQVVDNLILLKPPEARKYAETFYDATQGGLLGLGLGTSHNKIGKMFKELLEKGCTHMDLSYVAEMHESHVGKGSSMSDSDMWEAARDDMEQPELDKYIKDYVVQMPFIKIGDEAYTVDQWKRWIKNGAQVAKKEIVNPEPQPENRERIEKKSGSGVRQIQNILNKYCNREGIEFTELKTDGSWGPRTQSVWKKFSQHVFKNHPVFKSKDPGGDYGSWKKISAALVGDYPGYTKGTGGCLNFCLDAYNGDDKYGKEGDDSIPGGGGGSGGGGGGSSSKRKSRIRDTEPQEEERDSDGGGGSRSTTIPFSDVRVSTRPGISIPKKGIQRALVQNLKKNRINKTKLQYRLLMNKNKPDGDIRVKLVDVGEFFGDEQKFSEVPGRTLKDLLNRQDVKDQIIEKGTVKGMMKNDRQIIITITMPQGNYKTA